ncbi:MAG: Rpn family recombination-promoting nuclease/putative transposase [Candidatus Riflebacteria bacterium]|nr:Rpn family recombination-promoting nuclease/putative transposase [Candidatus Riflebacteria bacterium]
MNSACDKYFGLTNDLLFKIVFGRKGNEKLLALLLNALLKYRGEQEIKELEILNPINLPDFQGGKQSVIDVKAKNRRGEVFCVEVQVKAHAEILKRVLYYSAVSYSGEMLRGEKYTDLNKTLCLWIMCETVLPDPDIYNKYLIKHDKTNRVLTDLLEYHFVELSKFNGDKPARLRTKFEKWLHILKFGNYYRSIDDLPEELRSEEGICEVISNMSNANTDELTRHELFARDMFLSDLATDLDAARREGREEGIEEGIEKGIEKGRDEGEIQRAKKVALKMLAKGMPYEVISEVTDLSVAQIELLANENRVCETTAKYKSEKPRKKRK